MLEKCFSQMFCLCCFLCILVVNLCLLSICMLFSSLSYLDELIWTVCVGMYYFLVVIINLGLFVLIVKYSFDHVERISSLKSMQVQKQEYNSERVTSDTRHLFKYILLNLTFLLFSLVLNHYFDYFLVKAPLILYICWTLGFTASLPINKNLHEKLNNNQIKDYILSKAIINTLIFLSLYFIIRIIF